MKPFVVDQISRSQVIQLLVGFGKIPQTLVLVIEYIQWHPKEHLFPHMVKKIEEIEGSQGVAEQGKKQYRQNGKGVSQGCG
jgi:hypothetical protein